MSDARHTFLMFAPDFCNAAYAEHPLYARVVELFEPPFKGRLPARPSSTRSGSSRSSSPSAAQWPHSTYMMPGGVTCPSTRPSSPSATRRSTRTRLVRGVGPWLHLRAVAGARDGRRLRRLAGGAGARDSALGVFTTFGRVDRPRSSSARGTPHLLSTGCYYDPERWQPPFEERPCLQPRRLLRRRARRRRAVPHELGRRAHAVLPVRRSRRAAPSVGERDGSGRRARRGVQLRKGDALRRPRRAARAAGGPRARGRPAHHLAVSRPRGRHLAAPVHPAAPAGRDAPGDAARP